MKRYKQDTNNPRQFDANEFLGLTSIRIIDSGEENLYFEYMTKLGHVYKGFVKFDELNNFKTN